MTTALEQRIVKAGFDWIVPAWDAPRNVHALSTTRHGGVSVGARASLDLGGAKLAQDDDRAAVLENRRRLAQFLPAAPVWLSQVHGADVVVIDRANATAVTSSPPTADAAITRSPGVVLGVRTADCLPVLFADRAGTVIGAAHAGWRGLAAGVLEATVRAMRSVANTPPREIVAWFGPAIGPRKFEVGRDVLDALCVNDSGAATHFMPGNNGKWCADLYGLARRRLAREGVTAVAGGEHCTLSESERFFSYRANQDTGRMATVIWLAQ
jgi:polyphenol oxidase